MRRNRCAGAIITAIGIIVIGVGVTTTITAGGGIAGTIIMGTATTGDRDGTSAADLSKSSERDFRTIGGGFLAVDAARNDTLTLCRRQP